jgi:hypothetical protein
LGDLKIQGVLKQEEGLNGIKAPSWNKIKQEIKVAKPDSLVCHFGGFSFYR